jgi:hypothetical protein
MGDPNILGIGFGPRIRRGRVVRPNAGLRSRPPDIVVRFFVRRKLKRPRVEFRIPEQLNVRLKIGGTYVRFTFDTDVHVVGLPRLTGCIVSKGTGPRDAAVTAGVLLRWDASPGDPRFGLLTVAHGFTGATAVEVDLGAGQTLQGKVLRRASQKLDAAIVHLSTVDATRLPRCAQILIKPRSFEPRGLEQLMFDPGAGGESFPPSSNVEFELLSVLPEQRFESGRVLRDVLHVRTATHHGFKPTTSGSRWEVVGQSAAIQNGAIAPGFSEAFGQALEVLCDWSRAAVGDPGCRIVGVF